MALDLTELLEQLANEPQKRRGRQLLLAARQWWQPQTVTRMYDEMVRLARIDLRQAERLALAAAWLSEQLDDEASRATGCARWATFSSSKATTRRLASTTGWRSRFISGWAWNWNRTDAERFAAGADLPGRYDEAYAAAQTAYDIFSRRGDRLRLARLDNNMANILFRQDRFAEALSLYQRAYATFAEIGEPQDVAIA